jgi:predicted amidophosphoribosyltransferase
MDIQKVYQRLKDIQHFLLPGQCLLCLDTISHDQLLCECCAGELPRNDYGCRRCGKPMPVAVEECGECQKSSPAFDYVHTLYRYQPPVDQLVQQLKYNRKLYLARMFGEELREASAGWIHETGKPDLIVPVPLHQNRLRKDLSIVVIDDVITSGHTVNELARVLKRAGASRVGVWGIARA